MHYYSVMNLGVLAAEVHNFQMTEELRPLTSSHIDNSLSVLQVIIWVILRHEWSKSCSVVSDPLWPHGLYSPWNYPGQNTGVGNHSLLQESSQPRDRTQVSCITGRFFTSWATRKAQEYWSGWPAPSPVALPDPGIKLESMVLQADSSSAVLTAKSKAERYVLFSRHS